MALAQLQKPRDRAVRVHQFLTGVHQNGCRWRKRVQQRSKTLFHGGAFDPAGACMAATEHRHGRVAVTRPFGHIERLVQRPDHLPDLVLGADRCEVFLQLGQRLAGAQKQVGARQQSVLQPPERALLRLRLEVDQRVAAHHHIHAGKRRVREHVVAGKHNALAQLVLDDKAVAAFDEETLELLR